MFAGDESREDFEPPALNDVVVIPATAGDTAKLDDNEPPPLCAVLGIHLLQAHHAVCNALNLEVAIRAGQIVQEQDGAMLPTEELLEGQNLAAVSQRISREEPQFRK